MRWLLILLGAVLGCQSWLLSASPVMSAGPDTYIVYTESNGGSTFRAKLHAQRTAEEYCANMSRRMEHVSIKTPVLGTLAEGRPSAEMTFRCVTD
jgi:hypothetical protein